MAAPELETAPEHALLSTAFDPAVRLRALSAAFPPSLVGQFPVLRHGAVQPSGLPPSTSKRTRPRGAIPPAGSRTAAPSHVLARGQAESPPGGHPKQPLWFPELRTEGCPRKGGRRAAGLALRLASRNPLLRPKEPEADKLGSLTCPKGATVLVTDARLLQPGTGRKVEPSWD